MKKRFFVVFLAFAMVLGSVNILMAAQDDSELTITVAAIDALEVSENSSLSMDWNGTALTGTDDTSTLSYTHNMIENRQIRVEATSIARGPAIIQEKSR